MFDEKALPICKFSDNYSFLSNMYPCNIVYNGIKYPSTENAYVAQKTACQETRHQISLMDPRQSKKFGRNLELVDNWNSIKLKVMRDVLDLKFAIPELRNLLRDTYPQKIIEGNTWGDTFWGECPLGNGRNFLGLTLMKIRHNIILEENGMIILE